MLRSNMKQGHEPYYVAFEWIGGKIIFPNGPPRQPTRARM